MSSNRTIWVIGDAILDLHRSVLHSRPSPEDPTCPVGIAEQHRFDLGGAANVAAWLTGLSSAPVVLHCHTSRAWNRREQFSVALMRSKVILGPMLRRDFGWGTLKERIFVHFEDTRLPAQQVVRIDRDTDMTLTSDEATQLIGHLQMMAERDEAPAALVIADYGKGLFVGSAGKQLIEGLATFAADHGILTVINSKYPAHWGAFGGDFLICNEKEFATIRDARLSGTYGGRHFVITQAERGAVAYTHGGAPWAVNKVTAPTACAEALDVTGAGDAFLAGLTHHLVTEGVHSGALLSEERLSRALAAAQDAAATCCLQLGCGLPIPREPAMTTKERR